MTNMTMDKAAAPPESATRKGEILYVAHLAATHRLCIDPGANFASARLTPGASSSGAVISIDGAGDFHASAYPSWMTSDVIHAGYETLVTHLPFSSGLPAVSVAQAGARQLMYFEYDEMPRYAHAVCGVYRLSQILHLSHHAKAGYAWQIVFTQATQVRPGHRDLSPASADGDGGERYV